MIPLDNQLRIGLLIDSLDVEAWAFRCIEKILAVPAVGFVLLILNAEPASPAADDRLPWLYRLYNRIDEAIFGAAHSAFEKKSLQPLLSNRPLLPVRSTRRAGACEIAPADVTRVQEYHLDVLLRFGFEGLCGEIATACRYGVWSYAWGDGRDGAAGYWETLNDIPETRVAVTALSGQPERSGILHRSAYFTYPFSPARNRNALSWEASGILPRLLSRLQAQGPAAFFAGIEKAAPAPEAEAPAARPSGASALRHTFHQLAKLARELNRRLFYRPTWYLLFDLRRAAQTGLDLTVSDFTRLWPPKDRFWADPHVVFENGAYYVFVEEYLYASHKGHISVIEIDPQGKHQAPVRVLETDYHLSYPFVFEWQGQYYMIPETAHNHTIDLYACVEFPRRWEFRMHLMENVRAVDTTLTYAGGRWWLFTALSEEGRAVMPAELFLFSAPDFMTTDWTAHPCNPIVSDIQKARPAGRLFQQAGKLYRPSQYSHGVYGYGIDLNEVLVLSEDCYAEKAVVAVRPTWDEQAQATHTFSQAGSLTIIDAFTQRSKLAWRPK